MYGIPEFRLPKDIVQKEVDRLREAGVHIEVNEIIGKTWTLAELRERFDAVFVAVGAGLPVFMDVPGENLKGVYSANEYLTRVNLMAAFREDAETPVLKGQRVAVVGGGNVAMDAVRTSLRMGAEEAIIVYRRGMDELPARREEVHHAEQEGIHFELLTAPLEVLGDEHGWVRGLRCERMALGEPDASGRRRPERIPGSEFEIACDMVVVAIGTRANPTPHRQRARPAPQPMGLHRGRRGRHEQHPRRLRRRRHRARLGDRDPGHGRRQADGGGHRPLLRPAGRDRAEPEAGSPAIEREAAQPVV